MLRQVQGLPLCRTVPMGTTMNDWKKAKLKDAMSVEEKKRLVEIMRRSADALERDDDDTLNAAMEEVVSITSRIMDRVMKRILESPDATA
jgi:hypothetical protein